jgi:hypothetical protein
MLILRYLETIFINRLIVAIVRRYRRIKWFFLGRPRVIRFTADEAESFDRMIDEFAKRFVGE